MKKSKEITIKCYTKINNKTKEQLEIENKDLKLTKERLERKLKTNTEMLAIQLTKMTNLNIDLVNDVIKIEEFLDEFPRATASQMRGEDGSFDDAQMEWKSKLREMLKRCQDKK